MSAGGGTSAPPPLKAEPARYSSMSSTPASLIPPAPAGFLGEFLGFAAAARASPRSAGGLLALAAGRVSAGCALLALAPACALLSSAELRVIWIRPSNSAPSLRPI